ncbi:MAG: hypothetical protein ABFS32_14225 [Bacteroidota bacterium]
MKKATIVFVFIFTLVSCTLFDGVNKKHLTVDDFKKHLDKDMSYEKIVKVFGDPVSDIGSGIHIYVYELDDQTEVWIGYTDIVQYAYHMDADGNQLEILIE